MDVCGIAPGHVGDFSLIWCDGALWRIYILPAFLGALVYDVLDTNNAGGKKGAGHKERDVAYLVS